MEARFLEQREDHISHLSVEVHNRCLQLQTNLLKGMHPVHNCISVHANDSLYRYPIYVSLAYPGLGYRVGNLGYKTSICSARDNVAILFSRISHHPKCSTVYNMILRHTTFWISNVENNFFILVLKGTVRSDSD